MRRQALRSFWLWQAASGPPIAVSIPVRLCRRSRLSPFRPSSPDSCRRPVQRLRPISLPLRRPQRQRPAALRHLREHAGVLTVNLGSGEPVSVLQMVHAFERASGRPVPWRIAARRPGDVPDYWADPDAAALLLGWRTRRGVEQMCADAWRWQSGAARRLAD